MVQRRLYSVEDVGPGWKSLIEPLIRECEERGVSILQIKEKFGGLRFYIAGENPAFSEMQDKIDKAEEDSYTICEWCGAPGKRSDYRFWLKTLCEACDAKRREDRT